MTFWKTVGAVLVANVIGMVLSYLIMGGLVTIIVRSLLDR